MAPGRCRPRHLPSLGASTAPLRSACRPGARSRRGRSPSPEASPADPQASVASARRTIPRGSPRIARSYSSTGRGSRAASASGMRSSMPPIRGRTVASQTYRSVKVSPQRPRAGPNRPHRLGRRHSLEILQGGPDRTFERCASTRATGHPIQSLADDPRRLAIGRRRPRTPHATIAHRVTDRRCEDRPGTAVADRHRGPVRRPAILAAASAERRRQIHALPARMPPPSSPTARNAKWPRRSACRRRRIW